MLGLAENIISEYIITKGTGNNKIVLGLSM